MPYGIQETSTDIEDSLAELVISAYQRGVNEDAIKYVINALERGASGRRFGLVLSINCTKVWGGETPLLPLHNEFGDG